MKQLAKAIAHLIRQDVLASASHLDSVGAELRSVFNGPPLEILKDVFAELTEKGGIGATLANGETVLIPVLLQVEKLEEGASNPAIGASGACDLNHLLDLRNSPHCPRFIGLVPPGGQANISQTSTRSDFGLTAYNNSSAASIKEWWNDPFIQALVDSAVKEAKFPAHGQEDEAKRLIQQSVVAAQELDINDSSRLEPWKVLARAWDAACEQGPPPGTRLSLACGFPPTVTGKLSAEQQAKVLKDLANRMETGFRSAIENIKERAGEDEKKALDSVLAQLQARCEVATALARSMPHYYRPPVDAAGVPAGWWTLLTVESWGILLDDDDLPQGALKLECVNALTAQGRGLVPIVRDQVHLRVHLPTGIAPGTTITVTRNPRNQATKMEWMLAYTEGGMLEVVDDALPEHKTPLIYSAQCDSLKSGSIKVVGLESWSPGFIVSSRNAVKTTVPRAVQKKGKAAGGHEVGIILNGEGRHYLDVFVRTGVVIGKEAHPITDDEEENAPVHQVSDFEYGLEINAVNDRAYELDVLQPTGEQGIGRIVLTCEEVNPETCSSEFDRLIRLNRREGRRGATEVHLNRQVRSADLQSWLLDPSAVATSYYPLVLGPDYSDDWRRRDWTSGQETVYSKGAFVHDPRPAFDGMRAPEKFTELREKIAGAIRGKDGDGLVESAKLGEWMVVDTGFAEDIEAYVKSYYDWLSADPDNAAWCDISIVCQFESDGTTLNQEPDALIVSPLHPVRLGWHCMAQKLLYLGEKKAPCPAASILDPDCIPDALALPLRTPSGEINPNIFFSIECSSDYWSVLWNGNRLGQLPQLAGKAPFDHEFGLMLGSVSSGFSISQVQRSLSDVSDMLSAKPVLNVLISSAAGQNNACNEGVMTWCRNQFAVQDGEGGGYTGVGARMVQIIDERQAIARPDDAVIANLAEDTANAVRWYAGANTKMSPDLGIIAQLELSNVKAATVKKHSPMAMGGLVRTRIREQWKVAKGVILAESRMGAPASTGVDPFADNLCATIARLENLSAATYGCQFAPSPHTIEAVLRKADFAAVSSSTIDPACFLGGWLDKTYLWDYALPSYSNRSDDTNGYYLLSSVRESKYELLGNILKKLPGCSDLPAEELEAILLEVSRRGIPTVRGMSGGNSGASGDLGMFVTARLMQDAFRGTPTQGSLLPVREANGDSQTVFLLVPVDPFKGYFEDLAKVWSKANGKQRPDMLVLSVTFGKPVVRLRLTPIEVKYRTGELGSGATEALGQAKALSALLQAMKEKASEPDMAIWTLAFQHLLVSLINFAFRVYSQQGEISKAQNEWNNLHHRLVEQVYLGTADIEVDSRGRLLVIDASKQSAHVDNDGDGFKETIVLTHADSATIVRGDPGSLYAEIQTKVGKWDLAPSGETPQAADAVPAIPAVMEPVPGTTSAVPPEVGAPAGPLLAPQGTPGTPSQAGFAGTTGTSSDTATVGGTAGEGSIPQGVVLDIGNTIDGFKSEPRYLDLSNTNLNQMNIGVVGDLGTGKTQLLKSIVAQISWSGNKNCGVKPKVLIFDYKKDYSSPEFVEATGAKVVLPQHLPLNLFSLADANNSLNPIADRIRFFCDVLDKIYTGIGPVQRSNLRTAIKAAYEACKAEGRDPTIYDVHENYGATVGKADTVTSILDNMVDMELFSPNPAQVTTFDKFLDGVVVISLNALGQDDSSKNMIVAIMLNMFYERMLRVPKRPYFGANPQRRVIDSFLLVDEADKIMKYNFDVLKTLLLEGREFGVGIILASQYLSHFKSGAVDYKEPLLTWCIHKVPNINAQDLGMLGLAAKSAPLAERIKSLNLHECMYKTFDVQGEIIKGLPFYQLPKGSGHA